MRAMRIESLSGPDGLAATELPEPTAGAGDVLIEVRASSVVFPDLLMSRGQYQMKPDLPFVPGATVAGVVRFAPDGARVRPGDRVTALTLLGGWAELARAAADMTFPLADALSFEQGAVFPFNYLTMHFAYTRRGRLQPGETVVVHGAAGGVGTAAVQLGAALGARVIAVASTPDKQRAALAAGAQHAIGVDGFRDAVKELTDGRGAELVVDPVGGDRFTDSLRCLAPEGRLLVLGFTGGDIPTVKVNRLLLNNVEVIGVGWGAFVFGHAGYLDEQWAGLQPLVESGRLQPVVGRSFALEQAADALRLIDERAATGTLVITT